MEISTPADDAKNFSVKNEKQIWEGLKLTIFFLFYFLGMHSRETDTTVDNVCEWSEETEDIPELQVLMNRRYNMAPGPNKHKRHPWAPGPNRQRNNTISGRWGREANGIGGCTRFKLSSLLMHTDTLFDHTSQSKCSEAVSLYGNLTLLREYIVSVKYSGGKQTKIFSWHHTNPLNQPSLLTTLIPPPQAPPMPAVSSNTFSDSMWLSPVHSPIFIL